MEDRHGLKILDRRRFDKAVVGPGRTSLIQLTYHSLKVPGFNPCTHQVISWFQAFAFKCNLYRYAVVGICTLNQVDP
jgi:hypothetical protein